MTRNLLYWLLSGCKLLLPGVIALFFTFNVVGFIAPTPLAACLLSAFVSLAIALFAGYLSDRRG